MEALEAVLRRKANIPKELNPRKWGALEKVLMRKAKRKGLEEEIGDIDPKKWAALETVLTRKA